VSYDITETPVYVGNPNLPHVFVLTYSHCLLT
jgi:hypothetical protein